MTALVRYEKARHALAEAHRVDEVKSIRDKAEAMAAYARQAKDTQLVQYATEIKVRAERKAGEMLAAMPKAKGAAAKEWKTRSDDTTTLGEMGITKEQSSRWQQVASIPEKHFEAAVEMAKNSAGEVTTAFMLREAKRQRGVAKPMKGKKAQRMLHELDEAKARGVSMLSTYVRLAITAIRAQKSFDAEERALLAELHNLLSETEGLAV
jgi:hypothetical protein